MKPAHRQDKQRVVEILTQAFEKDPQINRIINPTDAQRNRRLSLLMEYAFEEGMLNGSIYLSDNNRGVAIWLDPSKHNISLALLYAKLRFAWSMGVRRIFKTLVMQKNVYKKHPQHKNYFYLWFLAVKPEAQGKGISSELLNPYIEKSFSTQRPIYLETSTIPNVKIYTHKGFQVFSEWKPKDKSQLTVWCLRR